MFFNSCTSDIKKEIKVENTKSKVKAEAFDWLLGNWKRNNNEEGKETFETWKKNSTSEYSGLGYTLKDKDTIQQEFIKLFNKDKKWFLEVELRGDPDIVTFPMSSSTSSEFVCKNKEHDFPKMIKYWKNGDKLNALVAGDDFQIPFEFERIIGKQF